MKPLVRIAIFLYGFIITISIDINVWIPHKCSSSYLHERGAAVHLIKNNSFENDKSVFPKRKKNQRIANGQMSISPPF